MRFIDLGVVSPEFSVNADKVIFESWNTESEDTLHIYTRDRPTISFGSNTSDTCLKPTVTDDNVSIVRRMSGGSAIYTDEWQITYCITIGIDSVPKGRNESFEYICMGLVDSLRILGLDPVFKPVNDIIVNGRKISGSAQYRNSKTLMQHGSIILRTPDVCRYLNDTKPRSYDGLTSVEDVLGYVPEREDIANAMIRGFSGSFGCSMERSSLTSYELSRVLELSSK